MSELQVYKASKWKQTTDFKQIMDSLSEIEDKMKGFDHQNPSDFRKSLMLENSCEYATFFPFFSLSSRMITLVIEPTKKAETKPVTK